MKQVVCVARWLGKFRHLVEECEKATPALTHQREWAGEVCA